MFHGVEQPLNLDALIRGQVEAITKLENVTGTGISMEFGGKSQTHTASGAKIIDLLV